MCAKKTFWAVFVVKIYPTGQKNRPKTLKTQIYAICRKIIYISSVLWRVRKSAMFIRTKKKKARKENNYISLHQN